MSATASDEIARLLEVVEGGLHALDPEARAALASHPEAVVSALAAAASTLVMQTGQGETVELIEGETASQVSVEEAERWLAQRTRPARLKNLLTSDQFARRAGVTRQTVHAWLKTGKIIGWDRAKHGRVFPSDQLDERGRPLNGLSQVSSILGGDYGSWLWLTTPLHALDGEEPLQLLRCGRVDEVLRAAQAYAQGCFA